MKVEALVGLPEGLEIVSGDVAEKEITLTVLSTQKNPRCPLCGTSATRVHSQYSRQLTDMSCAGRRVRLILHVRKFFCDETRCVRSIFAERLAPFIKPWARVPTRFFQAIENRGLATSGKLGARLGDRLVHTHETNSGMGAIPYGLLPLIQRVTQHHNRDKPDLEWHQVVSPHT